MNKKLSLLSVGSMLLLAACSPLSQSVWAPPVALEPGTPLELHMTPGTFTGSSNLTFNDELTVAVTVSESHILDIEVTQQNETPSFANPVFETMLPRIIEFNSTGVDIISGSTMTSTALAEAVEMALIQAGVDLDTLRAFSPPLVPGYFVAGVYEGVGVGGFGGNIYIETTFSDQWIENIRVVRHTDSAGLADSVMNHMIAQILRYQRTDIDIISDATITANAFLGAVLDTVEQASIDPRYILEPLNDDFDLNPGTFSGMGIGGANGDVFVSLTVNNAGQITDVSVAFHSEVNENADSWFDQLSAAVVANQTVNVDAVSGATLSSNAFLRGVFDAMQQSRDAVPVTLDTDTASDAEAVLEDEPTDEELVDEATDILTDEAEPEAPVTEEAVATPPADEPPATPATEPAATPEPEPESEPAAPAGRFTPGTFTGTGTGYYGAGTVTVSITVDDNNITAINFSSTDTDDFVEMARAMVGRAMAAQGGPVDIVTNATYTSNGFNQALMQALAQASN